MGRSWVGEGGPFEPSLGGMAMEEELEVEERISAEMDGSSRRYFAFRSHVSCKRNMKIGKVEGAGVRGTGLDGGQWGEGQISIKGDRCESALFRSDFLPIVSFQILPSPRLTFGRRGSTSRYSYCFLSEKWGSLQT